jgi:hypothetical protein
VEVGKSMDVSYGGWGMNWAASWAMAGGMAKVEDVYAKEVVIGPMCKTERIFAENVKLEQGSVVEQVIFTQELKTNFGVTICQPPRKVDNLPPPPF